MPRPWPGETTAKPAKAFKAQQYRPTPLSVVRHYMLLVQRDLPALEIGSMSLRDEVFEAAGGARWTTLRHFIGHFMLDGSLVEPLEGPHSLKEIVAEGDLVSRSI